MLKQFCTLCGCELQGVQPIYYLDLSGTFCEHCEYKVFEQTEELTEEELYKIRFKKE